MFRDQFHLNFGPHFDEMKKLSKIVKTNEGFRIKPTLNAEIFHDLYIFFTTVFI